MFFDIGANGGNKSKIFLKLGAKVIAVEPQNSCIKELQKIRRLNSHLIIVNKGVGNEKGIKELKVSNKSEVSTFSDEFIEQYKYQAFLNWDKTEQVEVITINDLIEQFGIPAYCKIDVENYEYEVLKVLKTTIPAISFEFNYPLRSNTIQCIEKLNQLGNYNFNYIAFEQMRFINKSWVSTDEIIKLITNLSPEKYSRVRFMPYLKNQFGKLFNSFYIYHVS